MIGPAMKAWAIRLILGLAALAAVIAVGPRMSSDGAQAQLGPFECPAIPNSVRIPIAGCEFVNLAVHPVDDIHIVFDGIVLKVVSDPASFCGRQFQFARDGSIKTVYDCRFIAGRAFTSIPSFASFDMLVLNLNPEHPEGAAVDSWYWTLNGTPVTITPTATPTPSPADFPTEPTPSPTAGEFPPEPTPDTRDG